VQPASPPEAESTSSNCDPKKIEKRLHHSLLPNTRPELPVASYKTKAC
jgi:hypothetical protein